MAVVVLGLPFLPGKPSPPAAVSTSPSGSDSIEPVGSGVSSGAGPVALTKIVCPLFLPPVKPRPYLVVDCRPVSRISSSVDVVSIIWICFLSELNSCVSLTTSWFSLASRSEAALSCRSLSLI
ncbi:uncharacterized protein LOC116000435 isoform X1 [Ipomoea triloba]|uniref:uncharacterized protein LOC116000435 isoform X1 n=1 Tax=Ipomoea triloba TaxID=35885 RepID=UPI00125E724F|nr:uncharacterized protein LOC116000435 isoform X1 [Ipomoea triloba]